ncbi:TPA: GIY-YIG nuclease family protein [Bacillus mycoides]|uniref:GIY-YIG nuclease family protein n=1 Tax=Bacillus sp. FSL P2-0099 TaxID=2921572 RepID=UPI0030F93213|nr:GIY-YIG nuclease family protein [Bacillus mycoides]
MRDKLERLLVSEEILPLSSSKWSVFQVDFKKECKEVTHKIINDNVPSNVIGVYVIQNSDGEVLYVGQGKVKERIKRHYKKLFASIPSYRQQFFQEKEGTMNIYWAAFERDRLVVETLLQLVLNPAFEAYKNGRKN